ncbi:MAG TPA: GNAT family N-acetyltransferase [Azospirillaceae bacterium]|nr:GNAT family N-acetyltransferase [Azospirillaceae bacterium]
MTDPITDNQARSRYELEAGGEVAFATYQRDGATVYIRHVEAPPALRGTGAAGRLMEGIMQAARRDGLKIVPICSYAAAWMRRHGEYADLRG